MAAVHCVLALGLLLRSRGQRLKFLHSLPLTHIVTGADALVYYYLCMRSCTKTPYFLYFALFR